jgi:hypothetical protein
MYGLRVLGRQGDGGSADVNCPDCSKLLERIESNCGCIATVTYTCECGWEEAIYFDTLEEETQT